MNMGNYAKIFLKFDSNFWGDSEILLVGGEPIGFMTWGLNLDNAQYFAGSNMLTFHFAGEIAEQVESQAVEVTKSLVMAHLRAQFGDSIPEPTDFLVTNWTHDQWTFGSYSNWPLGYTEEEHLLMKANEGRLHFAGEHMSGEYFGFVHGAWESGLEAAQQVLDAMSNETTTTSTADATSTTDAGTTVPATTMTTKDTNSINSCYSGLVNAHFLFLMLLIQGPLSLR
eukprot:gb/GFBE01047788.1/.p1 GENE.gb/GFBE01047788.1/~~gb/GFBE01047788.1/.p1  ORF type:complete len:226 (+),score=39.21 gb/GFBE01047788.1/:1-678(+)